MKKEAVEEVVEEVVAEVVEVIVVDAVVVVVAAEVCVADVCVEVCATGGTMIVAVGVGKILLTAEVVVEVDKKVEVVNKVGNEAVIDVEVEVIVEVEEAEVEGDEIGREEEILGTVSL